MGLFNSIMKGMGFKGDETTKKKKDLKVEKYTEFDNGLAQSFVVGQFKNAGDIVSKIPDLLEGTGRKNLVIYAPKNNNDIKLLVDCLRRKEACIVNLEKLRASDADKILQFISGAVYALRGSIKRLQGDLFLMVPEGINIMTQAK